ncbi:protein NRT1/ PTR FAMILY 2.7-like [Cucumis melo var. makuwa]|uniref:Protein NRT1/ PTR FAMILY 2.7-like n=1 Tax=Cucumis melo var. makuwa TaxID=1194695 RepID=A0A5D3BXQ9_CUCMM|nr:protein NRT1/ PTR FAMILY 2.7-like [Cucumis melo var. makuwa]
MTSTQYKNLGRYSSLAIFLIGKRFYRLDKTIGSPFTALARVLVSNALKRLDWAPSTMGRDNGCYYQGKDLHLRNQAGE